MKIWTALFLLCFIAFPLSLRADVWVSIVTSPTGATIDRGAAIPKRPGWLTRGDDSNVWRISTPKHGCSLVLPFTVTWVSGASVSIDNLRVCDGKEETYTITRPAGVDGVEIDAQYAIQLEQLALMERHMRLQAYLATRSAARERRESSLRATQESLRRQQEHEDRLALQRQMRTLSCVSRTIGYSIYTDCH